MDTLLRLLLTNAVSAGLLALLAWGVSRSIRRQSVVHYLWLLALVRLVMPPIAPLPLIPAWPSVNLRSVPVPVVVPARWESTSVGVGVAAPVSPNRATAVFASRATMSATPVAATMLPVASLGLAWRGATWVSLLAGALAMLGLTAWRFVRFGRLLACAQPASPAIADRAAALARQLGLRRPPPVLLVPARIPPMLWPERRGPHLLLPAGLLAELNDPELDTLLTHELAHVLRRDHWVRPIEIVATALFWWYPVTWWARRALRRAEERCCDEWVLRLLPCSAEAYASGLLKSLTFVAEKSGPLPAVASGAGPVEDLETRLKEILMTRPIPQLAAPLRFALAAAAILGLAVFPIGARSQDTTEEPAVAAETPAPGPTLATGPTPVSATPARPGPARAPRPALAPKPGSTPLSQTPSPDPVPALAPGERTDPAGKAFEEQRYLLEEQRRNLHRQQLELDRQSLELEARAERAELGAEAARLRGEGKAIEATRAEKKAQLGAQRYEVKKRQLHLEMEQSQLEKDQEGAQRERDVHAAALEAAGRQKEAEALRAELDRLQEQRERTGQELERKQEALEAEMDLVEKQLQVLAAEEHVQELRDSTQELARSLAEHIESLKEALPEAAGQEAELEREIQRLQAALAALESGSSPKGAKKTPPTQK